MCNSIHHFAKKTYINRANKAPQSQPDIVMSKGPQDTFQSSQNPGEIVLSRKDFTDAVRKMPKIQLHDHLEGSVRPQTILEEADRRGIPRPADSVEEMKDMVSMRAGENLLDFLTKFDPFRFIFDDKESLRRIAYEAVEDNHNDGVGYVELRMNCQKNRHNDPNKLSIPQVMDAVLDGMHEGSKAFGTEARFIASINRSYDPKDAMEIVKEAAKRKDRGVVGVDLAGDEVNHPPAKFKEVFDYARSQGLKVTIHAGEAVGPESISGAIDELGAERIGHGTRLIEDKATLDRVRDEDIHLEMCPHSNLLLNVIPNMKAMPTRVYHNHGISTSLNTDDKHIFDTNLVKEYEAMAEHGDFTLQEFQQMNLRGIEHAFIPQGMKDSLVAKFTTEYKQINEEIASEHKRSIGLNPAA